MEKFSTKSRRGGGREETRYKLRSLLTSRYLLTHAGEKGRGSHLKSGIPAEVEMPAPAITTIFLGCLSCTVLHSSHLHRFPTGFISEPGVGNKRSVL